MASPQPEGASSLGDFHRLFIGAWLLCSLFYFVQYALRSAPGIMVPELTSEWGLNASLDSYGAKWTIPAGVACLAVGTILFGWGSVSEAQIGRLVQEGGSAFAFVGALYLAAHVWIFPQMTS